MSSISVDFGDGTDEQPSTAILTKTFSRPGQYTITVTASNTTAMYHVRKHFLYHFHPCSVIVACISNDHQDSFRNDQRGCNVYMVRSMTVYVWKPMYIVKFIIYYTVYRLCLHEKKIFVSPAKTVTEIDDTIIDNDDNMVYYCSSL